MNTEAIWLREKTKFETEHKLKKEQMLWNYF